MSHVTSLGHHIPIGFFLCLPYVPACSKSDLKKNIVDSSKYGLQVRSLGYHECADDIIFSGGAVVMGLAIR